MMMKYRLFILTLLASTYLMAQSGYNLIANYDQDRAFFTHIIQPEETIYSISKQYRTSPETIQKTNSENLAIIHAGQIITVPYQDSLITYQTDQNPLYDYYEVYYQVRPKDNLFAICRRYFNLDIAQIMTSNHLPSQKLDVGQILFLGYYPLPTAGTKKVDTTILVENLSVKKGYVKKNGTAILNKSASGNGSFVLHRSARLNSEIEIYSPLTKRTTIAKVIGRLPNNLYDPEVDMIVSNGLAKTLHVYDKKFFVKQTYLPEN